MNFLLPEWLKYAKDFELKSDVCWCCSDILPCSFASSSRVYFNACESNSFIFNSVHLHLHISGCMKLLQWVVSFFLLYVMEKERQNVFPAWVYYKTSIVKQIIWLASCGSDGVFQHYYRGTEGQRDAQRKFIKQLYVWHKQQWNIQG